MQLFDLAADIGEQHNVADQHRDVVQRLTNLMGKYVADGRSTAGKAKNAVSVDFHHGERVMSPPAKKKSKMK